MAAYVEVVCALDGCDQVFWMPEYGRRRLYCCSAHVFEARRRTQVDAEEWRDYARSGGKMRRWLRLLDGHG